MAFLSIRLECADRNPALDDNRAYTLRKIVASLLELELRRDFETVSVTLHDPNSGDPELVIALRSPHDLTKLSDLEQKFLDDLNEMLSDSPYRVGASGGVYRKDPLTELEGVGIDWRAVMRAVNAQGPGLLPGVVASVIDGADEFEKKEAEKAQRLEPLSEARAKLEAAAGDECTRCEGTGTCQDCQGHGCDECQHADEKLIGYCPHCRDGQSKP